jgi:Ni,Fe-hydrogenase I small subunit
MFATVIVHRITTRVPLSQLKRHPTAYQLLIDKQCYLNEHYWDEQEWDLQQIGFITGFNPK